MLYDKIGEDYDNSRRADPYITERLLFYLRPEPKNKYLDLACGSGNYTIAVHSLGVNIYGIDQSEKMLNFARRKNGLISWLPGNAEALPFADNCFSGVICVLAIHHFAHLQIVFNEAARVMQAGQFVIFTSTAEQMKGYWLNHYFPEAMKKSIAKMPSQGKIIRSLKLAGFRNIALEPYKIRNNLEDYFLFYGKHKPEQYLDPDIRKNISTFAALADGSEIEKGCAMLSGDISSGKITEVMDSYVSEQRGDYLFITGCKV